MSIAHVRPPRTGAMLGLFKTDDIPDAKIEEVNYEATKIIARRLSTHSISDRVCKVLKNHPDAVLLREKNFPRTHFSLRDATIAMLRCVLNSDTTFKISFQQLFDAGAPRAYVDMIQIYDPNHANLLGDAFSRDHRPSGNTREDAWRMMPPPPRLETCFATFCPPRSPFAQNFTAAMCALPFIKGVGVGFDCMGRVPNEDNKTAIETSMRAVAASVAEGRLKHLEIKSDTRDALKVCLNILAPVSRRIHTLVLVGDNTKTEDVSSFLVGNEFPSLKTFVCNCNIYKPAFRALSQVEKMGVATAIDDSVEEYARLPHLRAAYIANGLTLYQTTTLAKNENFKEFIMPYVNYGDGGQTIRMNVGRVVPRLTVRPCWNILQEEVDLSKQTPPPEARYAQGLEVTTSDGVRGTLPASLVQQCGVFKTIFDDDFVSPVKLDVLSSTVHHLIQAVEWYEANPYADNINGRFDDLFAEALSDMALRNLIDACEQLDAKKLGAVFSKALASRLVNLTNTEAANRFSLEVTEKKRRAS